MVGRVAGFNSGAGMVAESVKKGVQCRCAGDAASLIRRGTAVLARCHGIAVSEHGG